MAISIAEMCSASVSSGSIQSLRNIMGQKVNLFCEPAQQLKSEAIIYIEVISSLHTRPPLMG